MLHDRFLLFRSPIESIRVRNPGDEARISAAQALPPQSRRLRDPRAVEALMASSAENGGGEGERMTGCRRTVFRGCTLCEATCGLALEVEGDRIVSVRGDEDDVFSHGYVCPKGIAIADVHHDPDRLRTPVRRTPDGTFEPIGWDEAFALVARAAHGASARSTAPTRSRVYMGNPIVHNHGALLLRGGFRAARSARATASAPARRTRARASPRRIISTAARWSSRCPTSTARTTSSASAPTPWCRTAAS